MIKGIKIQIVCNGINEPVYPKVADAFLIARNIAIIRRL